MPTQGEIIRCETCGHIISKRKIPITASLVLALKRAYQYCLDNGVHEFKIRDVRELLGAVSYTKFSDLKFFGGLVYKVTKGHYGLNMDRCRAFFDGTYEIPMVIWKDHAGNVEQEEPRKSIRHVPKLTEFLDADGLFIAEYKI